MAVDGNPQTPFSISYHYFEFFNTQERFIKLVAQQSQKMVRDLEVDLDETLCEGYFGDAYLEYTQTVREKFPDYFNKISFILLLEADIYWQK